MNFFVASCVALAMAGQTSAAPRRADCDNWPQCRDRALEAEARQDYETFHDFAWRAVQTGPKNHPPLMFLLARAESLSGRPHDALVMLGRIADSQEAREALTSETFAPVRQLAGWAALEVRLKAPDVRLKPDATSDVRLRPDATRDAFTFDAASFKPAALAYDRVSKRFIIADSDISRLAVVDEFTRHVATLASGRTAGFGTVTAMAIDPRAGDLWVASVESDNGEDKPRLHKLQLISGRVLKAFAPRATGRRYVDLAVAPDGTVVAVDGQRAFQQRAAAVFPDRVTSVDHGTLTSVAVSNTGEIYLSHEAGLMRVGSGLLHAAGSVDVTHIARIRWAHGSLVALQETGDGVYRLIRIRLGRDGRSVAGVDVLDPAVRASHPVITVTGDVVYYLAEADAGMLAIRQWATRN